MMGPFTALQLHGLTAELCKLVYVPDIKQFV